MNAKQKYKQKVKDRVEKSNLLELSGLPPDPWVVEYRLKNNKQHQEWKSKQPKKEFDGRKSNLGSFKKGMQSPRKITDPEKIKEKKLRDQIRAFNYRQSKKASRNQKEKERRQTDLGHRVKCNLRKRLSFLVRLHSTKKTQQTLSLLGCSMPEFLKHLESKFQDGMSFSNYGEWHIDHKIPCDYFDLTKSEQQAICFHYTNLQPLWAKDNLVKNNRLPNGLNILGFFKI